MTVPESAIKVLFTEARTHKIFSGRPVPDDVLRDIYETSKYAPTASNSCPMRLVFVKTPNEKAKLISTISPGNVEKASSAPVIVIVAFDTNFYKKLPELSPHMMQPSEYESYSEAQLEEVALRNSSIQAAFFILAARAKGLHCGPMSGFQKSALNEAFFGGTSWRGNFLVSLGYGSGDRLHDRAPRLSFEDACRIA